MLVTDKLPLPSLLIVADVAPPLNVIVNICGLVPQTDPLAGVILANAGLLQPQLLTVTPTLSVSVQLLALVTVTV